MYTEAKAKAKAKAKLENAKSSKRLYQHQPSPNWFSLPSTIALGCLA